MEIQKAIFYIAAGIVVVLLCLLCYCAGNNTRATDLERLELQATEYRATIAKLTDSITTLNSRLTEFAGEYSSLVETIRKIKDGSGKLTEDIQRAADINTDIIRSIRELQEASKRYIEQTSKGNTVVPNRVHNLRKPVIR